MFTLFSKVFISDYKDIRLGKLMWKNEIMSNLISINNEEIAQWGNFLLYNCMQM